MKILITGATGYIGSSLVTECLSLGYHVKAVVRTQQNLDDRIEQVLVGNLLKKSDWSLMLNEVDVVIHTAARAHVMNDTSVDPLVEFRNINKDVTLNIAKQAAKAGVKRFIFISSIGVSGNSSANVFTETDVPNPQEPYAISKYEAETGLLELSNKTKLEIVIIRPPLVYGPKAPGNFSRLVRFVYNSKVLPFGAIKNQRSFVALDNLISFIILCVKHPKATNEIFLISDGVDVSTTELLHKVSRAFGKRLLFIPVPISWMKFAAKLIGKEDVSNRLFGSLQVDSSKAQDLLGWKPVVTMDEQLTKMAKDTQ